MWIFIIPIISSSVVVYLTQKLKFDKIIVFLGGKLKKSPKDQFIAITNGGMTILFLIVMVIFIRTELTKNKRIIDLIINIINSIIKEEEDKTLKQNTEMDK